MRALLILAAFIVALPAWAGEPPVRIFERLAGDLLTDSDVFDMRSMTSKERAAFEKQAARIYYQDCKCLRFLFDGKIREVRSPLTDRDRWHILENVQRGYAFPLANEEQGF